MWHTLHSFIKELRDSDEARKRRWVWSASAVTGAFVVMLWAWSFQMIFEMEQKTATIQPDAPSFFHVFRRGTAILIDQFSSRINTGTSFTITPPRRTFFIPNVEMPQGGTYPIAPLENIR